MPEVNELDGVDKYIYDRLAAQAGLDAYIETAGGSLKIFSEVAPRELAFATPDPPNDDIITVETVEAPYIVFSQITSTDRNVIGRARVFTRPLYLVRAVTQEDSFVTAAAIADLIDLALHNSPPGVPKAGLQVMGFDRVQPVRFIEMPDGVRYNHVGGQYRGFIHNI